MNKIRIVQWMIIVIVLSLPSLCVAQQPQAQQGQPIYAVNAKYVQGVGPGYWATAGSGLSLNITAGTCWTGSVFGNYAGGSITLSANTTSYVYVDTSTCAPAISSMPAAPGITAVVTSATAVTSVTDDRTWFTAPGGNGTPGGANTQLQFNNSGAFGGIPNWTWDGTNIALNGAGALNLTGLANPAAPSLTVNGTAGSTSISYEIVAMQGSATTAASTAATTTTANATLSSTNSVTVTTTAITGSTSCKVYRTATNGTSPTTTGLIGSITCGSALTDTGLAGDGTSPSGTNTTGTLTAARLFAGGTAAGCLTLNELPTNGTNYIQVCSPATVPASTSWTWPAADGTSGQVLSTNGSGVLSWASAGSGANAIVNNPASTQTITPTSASATGLVVSSAESPTSDLFDVEDGVIKEFEIGYDGSALFNGALKATSTKSNLDFYVGTGGGQFNFRDLNGTVEVSILGPSGTLLFDNNQAEITTAAANSDIAGTIAIGASTTASVTFPAAYLVAPVCTLTPTSNPGTATWWVTTSTTAVTANLSASGTTTFNYICVGNPD